MDESIEELLENDEIDPIEAGFMIDENDAKNYEGYEEENFA